jgi:hypothetical protein
MPALSVSSTAIWVRKNGQCCQSLAQALSFLSLWTFRIRWDIVLGLSWVWRTFSSISGHIHPPPVVTPKNTSKHWHISHRRQGEEGTTTFDNGALTEGFVLKARQRSQAKHKSQPYLSSAWLESIIQSSTLGHTSPAGLNSHSLGLVSVLIFVCLFVFHAEDWAQGLHAGPVLHHWATSSVLLSFIWRKKTSSFTRRLEWT